MKTTIVIDEAKLKRIMKMSGIRTRRAAIDFALDQAERAAKVQSVFSGDLFTSTEGDVIDPNYDLARMRELERGSPETPPLKGSSPRALRQKKGKN